MSLMVWSAELASPFPWETRWTKRTFCASLAIVASLLVCGCNGPSPASILRTGSPSEAAAKAAELYDSNRDGKFDKQELSAAPSLLSSLSHADANRNGAIEIA